MKSVGQRQRLARAAPPCRRSGSAASTRVEAAFERRQRQDRRRAAQVARDARRPAGSRGVNSNGAAWPIQPDSGCRKRLGVARVHPDEGRRAGAAVEVLVAAADREVGARCRCRSTGTAPALCARSHTASAPAACAARGQRRHVVHGAGAVVDVGQHQHRDVARRARRAARSAVDQLAASKPRSRHSDFGDVEVGREVAALADTITRRAGASALRCSAALQHLVQVDRGASRCTPPRPAPAPTRRADLVAEALRQVEPAGACSSCGSGLRPIPAATTSATRAGAALGSTPSELPSR